MWLIISELNLDADFLSGLDITLKARSLIVPLGLYWPRHEHKHAYG
jgi:hypothetical protein